uniref:E3 ubiquitin-protein ligase AMFR n=1 Tax=Anopheles maculatus TaxID=74869 RepID=A0A182SF90_9DIPT
MMLWSNIFLSMASLVILMQVRYLLNEIQRKIKKHRNYLWVLNHMEKSYPLATSDDLKQNSDNCAICWEKMDTARKLPCAHLFHNSCLQSWLEQDTSCPTCRLGLSVHQNGGPRGSPLIPDDIHIDDQDGAVGGGGGRTANNHFFHFNGSRYVSWLPNFSVEVTHINNMLRPSETLPIAAAAVGNHTSQVRNMARHVQEMFPRYPLSVLIGDLQISRSIEVTIDNILEGRLQVPANAPEDGDDDTAGVGSGSAGSLTMSSAMDEDNADDELSLPNSSSGSSLSSLSTPPGYEVERGTNIFGSYDTLLRDDTVEESTSPTAVPLGDRFSKSPEEREKILQRRKEQLLAVARRRYLEKNKSELNHQASSSSSGCSSSSSGVRHRNKSCMETTAPSLDSSSGSGGSNLPTLSAPSLSSSYLQQRLSTEQLLDPMQQQEQHSDSSF